MQSALRRGGITTLPITTPSPDQFTELTNEGNRMIGSWNIDGYKVYTTSIDRYQLKPGQSSYFIGPSGDLQSPPGFNAPRPNFIERAKIVLLGSSPEIRMDVDILTDKQWAAKSITELAGPWPWELYNDGASPDSKLLVYPFPTQINDLELYTWQQIHTTLVAASDAVVLPDGYEEAIATNLGVVVCSLYPLDSKLTDRQYAALVKAADISLRRVVTLNVNAPGFVNDAAGLSGTGRVYGMTRERFYRGPSA